MDTTTAVERDAAYAQHQAATMHQHAVAALADGRVGRAEMFQRVAADFHKEATLDLWILVGAA